MASTGAEAFLNLHEIVKAARARTGRGIWESSVGAASPSEIDESFVTPAPPVTGPSVFGAFLLPSLDEHVY